MKRKNRLEKILKENFPNFNITVVDNSKKHIGHNNFDGSGETHFLFILKHKNGENKDYKEKIKIHNKINKILDDEVKSGLHSYEIKMN